ncbi:DUF3467 domain-containing protein [Methanobacterium alkalithermotolerans]|uniref:DUF3467 domain-containing protein n=1 Tax=Methanobacterium alkalithermotolerans TaxID=2731220 RepID=A0A8T8K5W5_9EURY|nr:DUF3467 domain-containing protein [Methanobacterium alkalithermotolerans]QUH23976.1 DUF3467 domain-containing protein [Methanobacterium alkalithermotolerans]
MNEKQNKAEKRIPVVIPSESPKIYATGAFGGHSAHDFRILFFSEEPLEQDEPLNSGSFNVMREVKAQLVLPPLAAKQLATWLTKQVDKFENQVGVIPDPTDKKKDGDNK